MTASTPLEPLSFAHKRTLVGNLLRGDCPALGFRRLKWMERDLAPAALQGFVVADDALVDAAEVEFRWRPDQVVSRAALGDWIIGERRTIHDDVLIVQLTVRNAGSAARTIGLCFLSEFEARKASAHYDSQTASALFDLSIAARVHVAVSASESPQRVVLRPYPNLVQRDLTSPYCAGPSSRPFLHDQIAAGWRFDLALPPGGSRELTLALACDAVAETAQAKAQAACADPAARFRSETEEWEWYFREEIPTFRCSDPRLEKLWLYHWFVQRSNITRHNHPRFPWAFQMPSKHTYPHLWFWDSAFHALVNRWRPDPRLAHDDLRTVALQQLPNGMIPHEVYLEPDTAWGNWPDGDGQASSITQLPIYAHAVWETYRVTQDKGLIADLLPALVRYDEWCARERDRDHDGLMSLLHRWEGWDTSPRWDRGLDIEPVDVNAMYYAQKVAIAQIARELELNALADRYAAAAVRTASAIRSKMWDAEAQTFFDLQGAEEMPVRVRTPAAFITLPFGIAEPAQAEALFKQLFDPQLFWCRYPIPTVALNEPSFTPHDYWRGPVWFNQNWFVLDGLRRYHRDDLAAQLLQRSLELLSSTGHPSAHEYFNPLTGEELGAPDLGWTGLCNDMIVRHVCGVQRADEDWTFAPLDIGLDWYELSLTAQGIRVHYDRQAGYKVERE